VFHLENYLLAGLWKVLPNALLLSALRNLEFVFLSAFLPFALTVLLTRKPAYGHIAALFSFTEAAHQFKGIYPYQVFADFNSDGHIGAHVAVLILVLLLAGAWRWGGFLWGLLPAIHPTMAIIVWPWAAAYFLRFKRLLPADRKRLLWSAAAGVAICGALAVVIWYTAPSIVPVWPYEKHANGAAIYWQFEQTTDAHRTKLPLRSLGYTLNPIALFCLIYLVNWRNRESKDIMRGLLLASVFIWAYVAGAGVFQRLTGWLPTPIQVSMPGRFANLSAMMLIPLGVAAIARIRAAPAILAVLLVVESVLTPYNADALKIYFMFLIWGAALAVHIYKRVWDDRQTWLPPNWLPGLACLVTALACLGVPVNSAWTARASHAVPGYRFLPSYQQLGAWLNAHASADEPILVPSGPPTELQPKIDRPVLMELETLYMMTYMPEMASFVGPMARDLYGLDYLDQRRLTPLLQNGRVYPGSKTLNAVWTSRTAEEWNALGRKYHFRYVLSGGDVPLQVTPVFWGPRWTVYSIQ
jgi:hypothetical protein